MAKFQTCLFTFFVTLLFTSLVSATFHQTISPDQLRSREKLTHIRFYFHEIYTHEKPSVIVMDPPKIMANSPLPFGSMVVMEDPLTIGPDVESRKIGKAQGFYLSATQRPGLDLEIVMGMTLTFLEGEFNGSSLSVLGRNEIVVPVREMPILGGTGAFRFARGFVLARTVKVDYHKGDATVEYNVYVYHYSSTTSTSSSHQHFNDGLHFMTDPTFSKI